MPRYWFPKPYADVVARLRVSSGFVLVAAFAIFSRPTAASLGIGIPVSLCGIWLRAWAAGHLEKNQRLATGGPYAHTRNPLYLGTLLTAAGLVAASRNWWLAALFGLVFALIYLPVIELEEQHLRKLFPSYAEYAERVPRLLPWRVRAQRLPGDGPAPHFRMALYRKNREYQALTAYLTGVIFLLWRSGI